MKKLFTGAILCMVVVMMAGTAWALNVDEHVIQAPNGKGDVLVFPHYLALPGWETKLVVTNTATNRSVVAKLIVRSSQYSRELRDFMIYLSPADVWTGVLYYDATVGASIMSTDDSVLAAPGVWASPANPMDIDLVDLYCDPNEIGYVTVIETWSSDELYDCDGDTVAEDLGPDTDTPVDKACIYNAYHNAFATTNDTPYNVLTGHYELAILGAVTAADQATILRDYDNIDFQDVRAVTVLGSGANNNLCEIEAALNKDPIDMPLYNSADRLAVHWVTFPTKLSVIDTDCLYVSPYVRGPYCGWQTDPYCIVFQRKYWDLSENTPGGTETIFSPFVPPPPDQFCWEVNFRFTVPDFVDANYPEGWFRYDFQCPTTCVAQDLVTTIGYSGAPAIALAWLFGPDGLAIIPSAHTDGAVTADGVLEPYYQYQNEAYNPAAFVLPDCLLEPGEFCLP
jgi:hypothetical protein